jgi:hypothetical protein
MPFGHPFDGYFSHVITPAVEAAGFRILRADQIYGTRRVMRDVWEHIWRARVVIADVSGANPNVNYELGLCHALGVPTVIITKQMADVPFDYRDRRCIPYDTNQARWESDPAQKLQKTIAAIVEETESEDDLPWPYDTAVLVSIARFNPTAFQAVRFQQPVPRLRQWRDGRIQTKRARGLRFEVSRNLVHEVSLPDTAGASGRASARPDSADLPDAGRGDRERISISGSYTSVTVCAAHSVAGETGAVHQRALKPEPAGGIPGLEKAVLGPAHVGARVFLRDGGRGG